MQRGVCPDEECRCTVVYSYSERTVQCRYCGQSHDTKRIQHSIPLNSFTLAAQTLFKTFLLNTHVLPKKGPDMIKVLGISNYHHKLISPLLTHFGVDKRTWLARSLIDLTGSHTLDCSVLGDRTFRVEERHLDICGYGLDQTGSLKYLSDTLDLIKHYNENVDVLMPLHADGDGHCLVHAVSRALVGRELFWHPLRSALKQHFVTYINEYTALLGDFINQSEWCGIIEECDPDFTPVDEDMLGLRNIHILGLANVLRRPILLLDNESGMKTSAEYSATFLPGLSSPELCGGKDGTLNPPICVAWSSAARNHFIPLVPLKDRPLPKFPRHLIPKVWGFPQALLDKYIAFDDKNCLTIGGEISLGVAYIQRLTNSIDELFIKKFGAPPKLVADVFHYNYRCKSNVKQAVVIEATHSALQDRRLQRCLTCDAVNVLPFSGDWLRPKGLLYSLAKREYGFLQENKIYPFRNYGVTCKYNAKKDALVVESSVHKDSCMFCQGPKLRTISMDGTVLYENGDITNEPVSSPSTNMCPCGFKHYWRGQLYDNPPQNIPVALNWNGKTVADAVQWFQFESQPNLNSNVYSLANILLQKHFPGEFGSERLHNSIVSQILERTKEFLTPLPPMLAEKDDASGGSITPIENVNESNNPLPFEDYVVGEPSCSGPIPTMRHSKKVLPQPNDPKQSSKKLMTSNKLASSSPMEKPFSSHYKSKKKFAPTYTLLGNTPVAENSEKMAKFLQNLYKNDESNFIPSTATSGEGQSVSVLGTVNHAAPNTEEIDDAEYKQPKTSPKPSTSKDYL